MSLFILLKGVSTILFMSSLFFVIVYYGMRWVDKYHGHIVPRNIQVEVEVVLWLYFAVGIGSKYLLYILFYAKND